KITLSSGGGNGSLLLRIFVDDTEQLLARVAAAPALDVDATATVELTDGGPGNGTTATYQQQGKAQLAALLHALQVSSAPRLQLLPTLAAPQPLYATCCTVDCDLTSDGQPLEPRALESALQAATLSVAAAVTAPWYLARIHAVHIAAGGTPRKTHGKSSCGSWVALEAIPAISAIQTEDATSASPSLPTPPSIHIRSAALRPATASGGGGPPIPQVHLSGAVLVSIDAAAPDVARAVAAATTVDTTAADINAADINAAADAPSAVDPVLLAMSVEERQLHLAGRIMLEVRSLVGRPVHPAEPLIAAGVDSRAGMELRRGLSEALGVPLPVTLLYDHQSVDEIVGYIEGQLDRIAGDGQQQEDEYSDDEDLSSEASDDEEAASADGDEEEEMGGMPEGIARYRHHGRRRQRERQQRQRRRSQAATAGGGDATAPSSLLKVLRPPPTPRPLFLAAPGVANAQSAYFSFSSFLQWADQPIYVLDKDNDLDIQSLARRNA
ncbi:hypothetical protein Vafri_21299, partial [Volvox africanus]